MLKIIAFDLRCEFSIGARNALYSSGWEQSHLSFYLTWLDSNTFECFSSRKLIRLRVWACEKGKKRLLLISIRSDRIILGSIVGNSSKEKKKICVRASLPRTTHSHLNEQCTIFNQNISAFNFDTTLKCHPSVDVDFSQTKFQKSISNDWKYPNEIQLESVRYDRRTVEKQMQSG